MTPKESIQNLVTRMPDNVTMEEVFYKLELFIAIYTGLQDMERGKGTDHEEFFAELLKENEEDENNMVRSGKARSAGNKTIHRQGLTKNGSGLHKKAKGVRK